MKNTTAGFTLIELLIVIAIIGILATALIPNLIKARTAAFDTAGQSCAKQINTAQEMKFIADSSYGNALTDLDTGATKGCDTTKMTITGSATNTGGSETYSYTVTHKNGSKTFTVTPNGITSAAKAAVTTP